MVWEQDCIVIINLTSLEEDDVTKCHQYWPSEGCDLYHIYEVNKNILDVVSLLNLVNLFCYFVFLILFSRMFREKKEILTPRRKGEKDQ